jgi:hypothetical protein
MNNTYDGVLTAVNDDEIFNGSFTISEDIHIIGAFCFLDNELLKKIYIPDRVKTLGENAFLSCRELETVKMSDSVTKIEYGCFENCIKLENITLSNSLKKLEESTFYGCVNLKSINMPNNLVEIKRAAFFACSCLSNITFNDKLKVIMDDAFYRNSSLKKIDLLNKDMIIENHAFAECINLNDINLSSDIKRISYNAFDEDIFVKRINIIFPNKKLTFNIKGKNKIPIYKEEDIFCIQNGNTITTVDCLGNTKEYTGENYKEIYEVGLFPRLHYISKILNKKNLDDFNISIIKTIPLDNDSIKSFYQNRKEWFNLINENELLKDKNIEMLFIFAFSLGLFSSKEEERKKARDFIKTFMCDIECLNILLASKPFNLDNGYNKYFASIFMKIYNTENKYVISTFPNFYKNFDKACEFTTYRKIKERTLVHSKITKIKKENENYKESDDYKELAIKEMALSRVIKNGCRDYLTYEDYIYYTCNINYEFKESNKELNNIKEYLMGMKKEKLYELEMFWEDAKKKVDDTKSAFEKVEDKSNKKIKYEILDSLNPINLIIGDIVNCCSTVNNPVGVYISKECVLNDEVRCIIIKNENNEIIGKATCYFNNKEKYILFNNFEMSNKFLASTTLLKKAEKFEKQKEAMAAFVRFIQDEVNTLNSAQIQKDGTLRVTKAYVGMGRNDLSDVIEELFIPITHYDLLENVDFSGEYDGDANYYSFGQAIIYDNDLNIIGGRKSDVKKI